jgi:pSer/pThr/pTyr-binding forkhead associated (FHA) protein
MIPIDAFLLILRLLLIALFYLFLMQVVIAIFRDLRSVARAGDMIGNKASAVLGHLRVLDNGFSNIPPGTSYDLNAQTTIGRGPTNTIIIPDSSVSHENTRIWYKNGVWYVQDAGSINGTFVNDQPAAQPVQARVGDKLRVGYILFQLQK